MLEILHVDEGRGAVTEVRYPLTGVACKRTLTRHGDGRTEREQRSMVTMDNTEGDLEFF